ncbi:ANTAR domain-containing protein [Streptomyces typhae]|uniref:ANTAR domain-containing protein n=1 Tax=Streptomyces typhae TaxID=2681492 RepID=UPI0031B57C53
MQTSPQTCPDQSSPAVQAAIVRLRAEAEHLRRAAASHAVVDQAIGVLIAAGRLTPEQGWQVLRGVSQHRNVKLRRVAELVVGWGSGGQLPPDITTWIRVGIQRAAVTGDGPPGT